MTQESIEGQGLPIYYLPHVHLSSDQGERSANQFGSDVVSTSRSEPLLALLFTYFL